ncbi:MAG: dienelactone hydrolase family protein [Phycisphaerales bacterium]|jgi:hypothetical protein
MSKNVRVICLALMFVLPLSDGCRRTAPSSLSEVTLDGVTSYYTYSNLDSGSKEGLPAIIFLGHPLSRRQELEQFIGQFDEPVLLIWCGLLYGLPDDTLVDDMTLWHQKRQDFLASFKAYKENFRFDEERVYLTGFSFTGAYAWMLAYDKPELYAGVVAMSAVSYPEQIQQNLESGESVVTVVVRGGNDGAFPERLEQEKETGRVIESKNPHSRFIIKQGAGHGEVAKYWLEYLSYILAVGKV